MEKIWRDFHFLKTSLLVVFILFLVFAFFVYVKELGFILTKQLFLLLIVLCVPLYFILGMIRNRLTYITSEGIRIGNAYDDSYERVLLKQKPKYLLWNEIKEIKIIGREVPRPGYKWLVDFLIIKTKNGQKYECFIADPKGFVKAIKELKKDHLFDKDSKYLDSLKKND